jgi:hydrogenase nickel incorporation protein HypA/HybF
VHELSIAHAVVDTVTRYAGDRPVREVTLRLGLLAGVAPDSLRFCWDLATDGTGLAGSALTIERVPLPGVCLDCSTASSWRTPPPLRCAGCGGRVLPTDSGRQLEIVTIDIGE